MAERFRISVFGRPRSPWRDSQAEAMADAIALELASWDESRREWFLAVPVRLDVRRAARMVDTGGARVCGWHKAALERV